MCGKEISYLYHTYPQHNLFDKHIGSHCQVPHNLHVRKDLMDNNQCLKQHTNSNSQL